MFSSTLSQLYAVLLTTNAFLSASAAPAASSPIYDAVIVGGGMSGLGAAKALSAANKTFLVLEARSRPGGRVHNVALPDGSYTEVGAEFVGPTQDKVIALAAELGIKLYPTYNNGSNILYQNGKATPSATDGPLGATPPVDLVSLLQVSNVQTQLDTMAGQVDVRNPWNATKAAEWDRESLGEWLDGQLLTTTARFILDTAVESVWSVEAEEMSLLYAVAYIAAAGNETTPGSLERLINTGNGGAQMYRVVGGTAELPIQLAKRLGHVQYDSPVKMIEQPAKGPLSVTTTNGKVVQGRHVIIAMSPPLATRIEYEPPLPAARDQLCQHMPMGSIGKAIALYSSPFWRKSNLTGQAISDTGLGRNTFDQSIPGNKNGALMTFLEADQIRAYDGATDAQISAAVQKDFVNYFGKEADAPKGWAVFRWDNEEFSRGGPVAVPGPNVLTQWGPALRNRVGNLHFVGTESSVYWVGYMDGALRSGYRAASEVV